MGKVKTVSASRRSGANKNSFLFILFTSEIHS
jgi:hypothetical protein